MLHFQISPTWIIVVFVVEQDPLLDDDFLLGVADVDHTEIVVRNPNGLSRGEGRKLGFAYLDRITGFSDELIIYKFW